MINQFTLSATTDYFNIVYFDIHELLLANGDTVAGRNGTTREFLNFKTTLKMPIKRCVGGYKRRVNIFFLLAEALWIFCGKKDVEFLDVFNSKLKDYSDDGINYHAPYGWRLRNYGVDSESPAMNLEKDDSNKYAFKEGIDQVLEVIKLLHKNSEDRRAVMSIWNPELDLGINSKDIPCNDLVMYKIRGGKLYTTIANRSNDLNLGLLTNVFQFSFISEIVSKILGVGLGDQVHNSQSLHLYTNHPLTNGLHERINGQPRDHYWDLYEVADPVSMDFNFSSDHSPLERLRLVDFHLKSIYAILKNMRKFVDYEKWQIEVNEKWLPYLNSLKMFSRYFYFVYKVLEIYSVFKLYQSLSGPIQRIVVLQSLENLVETELPEFKNSDYYILAQNFFMSALSVEEINSTIMTKKTIWNSL